MPIYNSFLHFPKGPEGGEKKKEVDQIAAIKIIFLYSNVQNDLGGSKKPSNSFFLCQSYSARNCKAAVVAMVISWR